MYNLIEPSQNRVKQVINKPIHEPFPASISRHQAVDVQILHLNIDQVIVLLTVFEVGLLNHNRSINHLESTNLLAISNQKDEATF